MSQAQLLERALLLLPDQLWAKISTPELREVNGALEIDDPVLAQLERELMGG